MNFCIHIRIKSFLMHGYNDALDKQESKSKLLVCCIAQFVESLRRNRWGPGSNPYKIVSKGYSANLFLHINVKKYFIYEKSTYFKNIKIYTYI